jgi:hypothetical protein
MINQIATWQMVIDLCLVTSILVMAFRAIRSSRVQSLIPQMIDLEARVSKLVTEAEGVARHLNDQLLRREQNIHKYVTELEQREKEISLTVVESESLSKELSLMCEGARRESAELAQIISSASRVRTSGAAASEPRMPRRAEESRRTERLRTSEYSVDEDEHMFQEPRQFSSRGASRRASEWLEQEDFQADPEPTPAASARSGVQTLQDLYHTAEEMLKSGRKPKEVSEKTKLPFEGVERLAQMIEIEREERKVEREKAAMTPDRDSRLGALGVSRRPTSTL